MILMRCGELSIQSSPKFALMQFGSYELLCLSYQRMIQSISVRLEAMITLLNVVISVIDQTLFPIDSQEWANVGTLDHTTSNPHRATGMQMNSNTTNSLVSA